MQKIKELNACIAVLQAIQAGSKAEPEQKKYVERAIDELRKLRRKPHAKRAEINRSVREVVEALAKAFWDR